MGVGGDGSADTLLARSSAAHSRYFIIAATCTYQDAPSCPQSPRQCPHAPTTPLPPSGAAQTICHKIFQRLAHTPHPPQPARLCLQNHHVQRGHRVGASIARLGPTSRTEVLHVARVALAAPERPERRIQKRFPGCRSGAAAAAGRAVGEESKLQSPEELDVPGKAGLIHGFA